MNISQVAKFFSIASVFGAVGLALPVQANSINYEVSANLLPLESRSMDIEIDPDLLREAATDINDSENASQTSPDFSDALGIDFLDDLVDEDGDVNLPLGITVFDAMGTTSVGFGSDF